MSVRIRVFLFLLLVFGIAIPANAQEKKAKKPDTPPKPDSARSDDRAAIGALLESFVKAFEARDAKGLAGVWTAEGEYHRDPDVTVQGQAALEKAFAAFFAKTPEVKAQLQAESL